MVHGERHNRWAATAMRLVAVTLSALVLPSPTALASTQDSARQEPGAPGGDIEEVQPWVLDDLGNQDEVSRAIWPWSEGNMVFVVDGSVAKKDRIRGFDATTHEPVASARFSPRAWGSTYTDYYAAGHHMTAAVDGENGRVFVAFRTEPQSTIGKVGGEEPTGLKGPDSSLGGEDPGEAPPCPGALEACVGGFHVFDARTLRQIATVPLRLDIGTPIAHPVLRDMRYLPADPATGLDGALLMIVEDMAPSAYDPAPARSGNENAHMRRNNGSMNYAVQFDLATMRQQWAVRLEGCRNSREERNAQQDFRPYPLAAFRVTLPQPALLVGCHGSPTNTGVVVRVPLGHDGAPTMLPVQGGPSADLAEQPPPASPEDASRSGVAPAPSARQRTVFGPDKVVSILADPPSQRILMMVHDGAEVWWVYDGHEDSFVGTIGIGAYAKASTQAGIDAAVGRLYVLAPPRTQGGGPPGGLYVADIRRKPLPQALHLAHHAGTVRQYFPLSVVPADETSPARIYGQRDTDGRFSAQFNTFVDRMPVSVDPPGAEYENLTLDLEETPGATQVTFDGVARGYAFRAILIGGAEAATRAGPADPVGAVRGVQGGPLLGESGSNFLIKDARDSRVPPPDPCTDKQRELVVAFVGPETPATVDASGSRGSAQPVLVDTATREDTESPVSRCSFREWDELWSTALVSRAPAEEPRASWPFTDSRSTCTSSETGSAHWDDPVTGMFSSAVECSRDGVEGWGQARGVAVGDLSVSQAISSFRVYRDRERGMVARIESIARGVELAGLFRIDTIRGSAESWANGRRNGATANVATAEAQEPNPFNCDTSRTAGTCFQRSIFGATVGGGPGGPSYRCAGCGDEDALVAALNSALGANGTVRFREPDERLARGADNGYIAAIQKPDSERYADAILNQDLLDTVLPAVEIVRFAPQARPALGDGTYLGVGPRGRQIFQFAGVEAASTYSIQCLLVYDAEAGTCADAPAPLGSLTVQLTDADGAPLAGGAFEVRRDVDTDGIVGLVDELVAGGACLTAEDGIGTCTFTGLEPGAYLVSQTAAPPGYSEVADPWVSNVAPGEARTVTFTNVSDVSRVEMTATDADGDPVQGATFAVFADPDADGKVAPDAEPVATCVTDAGGVCAMEVPTGSYVLVQTVAPAGMEPIEPVAFSFASGGQTAAVNVVNRTGAEGTAPPPGPVAASPVTYTDPPAPSPTEQMDVADTPATVDEPVASVPDQVGGTVVRVIRAPGDALRLLARDPLQALAWTAALALFALALLAVRRRQLLGTLTATPVLAFTGSAPTFAPPRPPQPSHRPGAPAGTVLDRPVAGGAPSPMEGVHATVVVATASPTLTALATGRLATADRVTVIGVVDSWAELRATLDDSQPDVVIVDLALHTGGHDDVCDLLSSVHRPDRTVGLIPPNRSVDALVNRGLAAGLGGMLVAAEDLTNGHLGYTVRCVAAGKPCFGPSVQAQLLNRPATATRPAALGRPAQLSRRELEVAELAAAGASRTEIAERLYLSPGTVKRHLRAARAKLGVINPWDREQFRRRYEEARDNLPQYGGADD